MKRLLVLTLVASVTSWTSCSVENHRQTSSSRATSKDVASKVATNDPQVPAKGHDEPHGHSHGKPGEVPAFLTDASSLKALAPTLSPALFTGKQREGYEAAKSIPKTLAQLPCYCHCDKGFGHKSLHSCFVDDHASQCAVCIDEALMALRMEKEQKLTPQQIREKIVEYYSAN